MTSRYIKPGNHWFWFFSLLIGYSVYDYIEHVTRPGQIFGEHPWAWLAFTFSLVAVDILTICFVNAGLKNFSGGSVVTWALSCSPSSAVFSCI